MINKPQHYDRIISLVTTKKLRLLDKVKLAQYKTGTHARHLDNAQLNIVKDLDNSKYQYFLKIRKFSKLEGREPILKEASLNNGKGSLNDGNNNDNTVIKKELLEELKYLQQIKNQSDYENKLAQYNADNFIYLPLTFNTKKLKAIDRTIQNILSKENSQVLLKSEQLRIGSKSRKIHLIFKYEEKSKLGHIIENGNFVDANELNTLGLDINLKHNLLADSNGKFYDDLLNIDLDEIDSEFKTNDNSESNDKNSLDNHHKLSKTLTSKTNFLNNLNKIVLLQSIETSQRTEKQKYEYQKLLRCNESLIKTYLSGLIKDWKSKDILHLVLEDLNMIGDKSYYAHAGVKIKYSGLSRLLRLSQIKVWIASMADKQGLFTHLVNPAYTSQECSVCHHISSSNRIKQEVFQCVNKDCHSFHVEINADYNSALNIKNRVLNKELRQKLNKDNVYLCSRPNLTYYKNVKDIIDQIYQSGVVTELLPQNTPCRMKSKEDASSFRTG